MNCVRKILSFVFQTCRVSYIVLGKFHVLYLVVPVSVIMADACVAVTGLGSNFKLIKQGAEAKLYKGIYLGRPTIVKERFKKSYRHVDLDNRLTKERMKSEARAILKCKAAGNYFLLNFPTSKNNIFIL